MEERFKIVCIERERGEEREGGGKKEIIFSTFGILMNSNCSLQTSHKINLNNKKDNFEFPPGVSMFTLRP